MIEPITIDACEFESRDPRKVYIERHGELRTDQYVCHRYDDPYCTKDSHHFIGTCQDNIIDAVEKGRHSCFTNVKLAYAANVGRDRTNDKKRVPGLTRTHVTKEDVLYIKSLHEKGVRWGELKRLSGRSSNTITRVLRGEYD